MFQWLWRRFGYEKRATTSSPSQWLIDWVRGGAESSSGVTVNESSSLKHTPFWAAVRIISGTVGALPFQVYRRLDNGGKMREASHAVYDLLHNRPNPYMDALTFIESRQAHVLTYGNGFAEIQRNGAGRPIALWPLLPDRTERKITPEGLPYYEVRPADGPAVRLADENVLHIKGLGFDGYTGYDVVTYHREAIGYGVAVKRYGARFFANDANPGGTLSHPGRLSDPAYKRLKESWNAQHEGLDQAHRMQILEEGMKWEPIGVEPQKAQALEIQKFTVDDCSRIFNIPPHKLGSLDRATYTNIEEQNIDFVTSTMFYWFRKWEQECNYKLFSKAERATHFCEILVDGLLRGNVESRSKAYATGRQWGYLSINDIRRFENMNPIGPEGDIYLDPLNMVPAGQVGRPVGQSNDDVRAVHYQLLAAQLGRILRKQVNAVSRGVPDEWWTAHRDWALRLLHEPSMAYASVHGNGNNLRELLEQFCGGWLQPNVPLTENDNEILAQQLINQIGVRKNAVSE